LQKEGIPAERISFVREVEMRYKGQSSELAVVCAAGTLNPDSLAKLCSKFHEEYERAYGRGYPAEVVELVNYRVTAVGAIPCLPVRKIAKAGRSVDEVKKETRPVFFTETGGFTETSVYDRYKLEPGHHFTGPAVVEEMDSNTLIHPDFAADVDTFGNLIICPRVASS